MVGKWRRCAAALLASVGLWAGVACSGSVENSGGGVCIRYEQKLRGCDLLTPGVVRCSEPDDAEERCQAQCLLSANCVTLEEFYCQQQAPELENCLVNCRQRETAFRCADGSTVPEPFVCDGYADCSDGSDEARCPTFDCGDGMTVPLSLKCSGYPDCSNGADEAGCPVFRCQGGETIPEEWRCDGGEDCYDGSDEAGCPQRAELKCG